jgi:hypothetical protein
MRYWRPHNRRRRCCRTTPSPPPGLEQPARIPQFTVNALAPALFNSNAQFLRSGGSNVFEGSPLIRLGWASQLFDTPIRISGAASFETERFVNGPGAAIDYIRPSARAQYTNPQDDQDFSPYLSYVPRLDFAPTFANNFCHPAGRKFWHRQGVQF